MPCLDRLGGGVWMLPCPAALQVFRDRPKGLRVRTEGTREPLAGLVDAGPPASAGSFHTTKEFRTALCSRHEVVMRASPPWLLGGLWARVMEKVLQEAVDPCLLPSH
jgi:hypothetical protein